MDAIGVAGQSGIKKRPLGGHEHAIAQIVLVGEVGGLLTGGQAPKITEHVIHIGVQQTQTTAVVRAGIPEEGIGQVFCERSPGESEFESMNLEAVLEFVILAAAGIATVVRYVPELEHHAGPQFEGPGLDEETIVVTGAGITGG